MPKEDALIIDLRNLAEGLTTMQVEIGNDFFQAIENSEISGGRATIDIEMRRIADTFRTQVRANGTVDVTCDRCLDSMQQDITTDNQLLIRLGTLPDECDQRATQYSDDGETIIVDQTCGEVNLAWFVYESIALALPTRRVHAPGQCNDAMIERIEQLNPAPTAARSSNTDNADIDPRWNALKNIKLENNKK